MAHPRAVPDEPAHGGVRAGRAAGGRGDDDARPLPVARVVLYRGAGCGLCDEALAALEEVRRDAPFELSVVEIDGDEELERAYRALLPVVEVDGEQAFVFEVDPDALRERLGA